MAVAHQKNNWQKHKIKLAKSHLNYAAEEVNNISVVSRDGQRKLYLENGDHLVDFASCSYLGLDMDSRLIEASKISLNKSGVNFAVSRTRLRIKNLDVLDSLLDRILCNSHTTLFTSLHIAHMGMIPLIGSGELPSFPINQNGIHFVLDKNVHMSIQINRGLLAQFGEVKLTSFLNISKVTEEFKYAYKNKKTPIAFVDGIGSMGGFSPVVELINLAEKYNGYIYFDDAHGMSLYGKYGCGHVLSELGNTFHPRLILATSLSKGFGSNSAVIALPSHQDLEIVRRFSIPYIFSNPPVLSAVDAAIASAKIHLTDELNDLQNNLWGNVDEFDMKIKAPNVINKNCKVPIRGILIGNEFRAIKIAKILKDEGYFVNVATFPTVEKDKSILRISLCASHKKNDVHLLCDKINSLV